jgi:hypothetical protein
LHGVDHEQGLDRRDGGVQLANLPHHGFIDPQATGGVDQQDVVVMVSGPLKRRTRNLDRLLVWGGCKKVGPRLTADGS